MPGGGIGLGIDSANTSEASDIPVYNTKAVSVRTGVPADTLRAWERRYGVPKPHRTEGAQRLYSERDIASIRWLKQHTEMGLSIRQAIALMQANEQTARAEPVTKQPDSVAEMAEQLFEALMTLDSPHADQLLGESFARYGVETTCLNIIQPAMYRVGEEWASGNVPIAMEHFASYFIRSKLSSLAGAYGRSGTPGTVITACAPGEQHELGLIMLALFIMRRGVNVIHLGADLPVADLRSMIERVRPRVVCLSASTVRNAETLLDTIKVLDDLHGVRPQICYGGYAFMLDPSLRERVDGLWLGMDTALAAETIRGLVVKGV